MQITTKHKFALMFSVYVFVFFMAVYGIFFVIFSITTQTQIKNTLTAEVKEIINAHLVTDGEKIIFIKDNTNESLREHLINDNIAAVFINKNGEIERRYGLFAYENQNDQEDKKNLKELSSQSLSKGAVVDAAINWKNQSLLTKTVPIKNGENIIGAMIVGKSLEEYQTASRSLFTIFTALGMVSLAGSFLVGYLLARKAFQPLNKMTEVVEEIDLDRLDKTVPSNGNPNDELVILARKMNEMIARLKEMSERQKQFIANASHELKTPLTRAITSLELISPNSPSYKEDIKEITGELFHINDLIEKLLLLTKLKKDIIAPAKNSKIDLQKLILKLKKTYGNDLTQKKISIELNAPPVVYLSIPEGYLEIIFSNLVSNAIKYSPPAEIISITARTINGKTEISVSDKGMGINKEDTRFVFDRFFRSKDTASQQKGYGIGLSIVKHICDLYDIGVNIKTEKNKGTTLTLTFNKNAH